MIAAIRKDRPGDFRRGITLDSSISKVSLEYTAVGLGRTSANGIQSTQITRAFCSSRRRKLRS